MAIEFIQFLRPHGRRSKQKIERPQEVEARAELLKEKGYEFHAEMLTTGQVSLTVFDPETEADVAIEVIPNGPEVLDAVDRLIMGVAL